MKNLYKTTAMMICFFIAHSAFADVTADFTADETTIVAGTEIQFTDLSTGNPTSWQWDFENDGTIDSYIQNPSWTFEEPGLFTVSLTVSDGTTSDTETKTNYIDVRVYIPDENFKARINYYLRQPPSYNPTIADLNGIIGYFYAGNSNITSIEGAQYLTNLTRLILDENQISDISTISDLPNLIWLHLNENQISDISVLSGLSNLISLYLNNNQISDISSISDIPDLAVLDLNENQISDISVLSGLTNLRWLYLSDNQISDISDFSDLTNLISVDLSYNQINDISVINNLTNIKRLYLSNNKISDISVISGLTNLMKLYLCSNQISDIYPLVENFGLGSGDILQLYCNPLSQEALNVHIPILESRGFDTLQFPSTQNNYAACYPNPARYEKGVNINADLEWQGNFSSRDAFYDVWLGETSDDLVNVGYGTAINDTLYSFTPDLNPDTDYCWKLRAITTTDTIWSGLWSFSTYIIADFSAGQTSIEEGDTIQFTDLSIGNPTSWEWDFENDGIIDSYEQNPEWIYTEAGTYSVSLTVSKGIYSDTKLKENYIIVNEAQTPHLVSITPGIEEITLEWGAISENKTGHFNFGGGNCGVWCIYIGGATINGTDMVAGDEIAVFDGDLMVGAFTLNQVCTPVNQFENALPAYQTLFSGPGFQPGNTFTMVAWDESAQLESSSFEYTFSDPYGGAWTGNVFPDGDGLYSMAEFAFTYYVPTFNIYYEDETLVAGEVEETTYTDLDLTGGQEYCYYITQIMENGEESNPSIVLCATPLPYIAPVLASAIPDIEEISLEWEAIPEKDKLSPKDFRKSRGHWNVAGDSTGYIWEIYIGEATFDGIDMVAGDEIGVFDGDLLVGAYTLNQVCTSSNQFENVMIAFSELISGPGYQAGNTFTIVAWDGSAQMESISFEYTFEDHYGGAWMGDVFPTGDGQYSLAEFTFINGNYIPTFNIYYENGTLVAGEVEETTYTDLDLTAGQEYCYYVTQIMEGGEESDPSNVLCATPLPDVAPVLVSAIPGPEEIYLEWEAIPEKDNALKETEKSKGHWNVEPGPNANIWTIYVGGAEFNIARYDLEAGDEIAIFDGDLLVGAFTLTQVCTPDNAFYNVLNAYDILSNGPGYTPGNPFIFKAWDQSENLESTLFEYTFSDPYPELYTGDVFPDGEGPYSLAELSFSSFNIPTFNIYYEDGALVACNVEGTTYTDTELTAGQEYCYYVTQILESGEESDPSNLLCATPLENLGIVAGTISNGVYPIEGALVTLEGTIYSAISGIDGTYAIEVEPGTYDVTVSAEGYVSQTKYDQIIILGETTIIDFMLIGIQNYDLVSGFQFISSRLIPENPDMLVVVEEILNENLDFIRNSQGQVLRKIGPNWVNGIGNWIVDEGYLVKMFADDSFVINGSLVDPTTPIPVDQGFQFVSYFPETPMDALIAFATIIGDNLDFVRNSNGQSLRKIGPNWVNGLDDCQPSDGYLVKMYAADVLIYPCSYSITCGDTFTDLRDGQIYNAVQIGDQCWMGENMNIGTMIYSTEEMTDNGIIEKYCYNNVSANCEIYGGLYQWNEMMGYCATAGVQGICPAGWHLPTDEEWTIITDFLGGELVAGGKMKEIGTTHWNPPNTAATNESGLTTLPGGYLNSNGSFLNQGNLGYWLSSTELSSSNAWSRIMSYYFGLVFRGGGNKADGFSVRCIKDYSLFDNMSILQNAWPNDLSGQKPKNFVMTNFLFEGGNPAEAVYTLYINGLKIGDEVAAFDGEKMIGSTRINSQNTFENELPVFSTLTSGQGYKESNPIILKVWSENNIVSADFTMESIYDSYVSDVYPEGDGKYSVVNIKKGEVVNSEETISIYPNPSTGIFNISIEGGKGDISIKVFDLRGKEYSNFELNGSASRQLDLTELSAGVYFISFNSKNLSMVKKIVIQ